MKNTSSSDISARAEAIIDFWFADIDDTTLLDKEAEPFATVFPRWYGKDPAIDEDIRRRFEPALLAATRSDRPWHEVVDAWARAPDGLLALVLLLDQFPRNIYRGTAGMYAHDALVAWVAALAMRELQEANHTSLVRQMFLYVPLMHVESENMQRSAVARFEELAELAKTRSPQNSGFFEMALDFARRHLDVIEKYGRFPHRNAILGRSSTPAEEDYLSQDGAGF